MPVIFEIAWTLGLVPLLVLAALASGHRSVASQTWWMAVGFAVSWIADLAARLSSPPFVSQLYPVTQAGIFIVLLAPKRYVEAVFAVVLAAASASVAVRHGQGWDVLLRVVAFGTVALLAHRRPDRWRESLGLYFGGGAVCWLAYVADPGWLTWGAMQLVRAAALALWCGVAWRSARRQEVAA